MKLVTKEVYTQFVQDLVDVQGLEVPTVDSVVQTIDGAGAVRAQVIFFAGDSVANDIEPQYMIDTRVAFANRYSIT